MIGYYITMRKETKRRRRKNSADQNIKNKKVLQRTSFFCRSVSRPAFVFVSRSNDSRSNFLFVRSVSRFLCLSSRSRRTSAGIPLRSYSTCQRYRLSDCMQVNSRVHTSAVKISPVSLKGANASIAFAKILVSSERACAWHRSLKRQFLMSK